MKADPQVVIVGGGPVGLACALALVRRNIPVLVLEQALGYCDGSRAICFSRRTLQIMDRLGVADPFVTKGLHWTEGHSYLGDREVFHLVMSMSDDDRFPPFINLQQYYAEQFLDQALAREDLVHVCRGAQVEGVTALEQGARVTWQTDGGHHSVDVPWVVAADGARSTVRRLSRPQDGGRGL